MVLEKKLSHQQKSRMLRISNIPIGYSCIRFTARDSTIQTKHKMAACATQKGETDKRIL